jgi:protein CpxP
LLIQPRIGSRARTLEYALPTDFVCALTHRQAVNEKRTIIFVTQSGIKYGADSSMNQPNRRFTHAARAVAATVVALTVISAPVPVFAAESSNELRAEAHIKDLHSKLKITAAEESQWARVAEVIRDNAKKLDELTGARMANATTAVENINAYGVIAYAHADGIKRFAPAFAALYAGMPNAQKVQADELFRHGIYATWL